MEGVYTFKDVKSRFGLAWVQVRCQGTPEPAVDGPHRGTPLAYADGVAGEWSHAPPLARGGRSARAGRHNQPGAGAARRTRGPATPLFAPILRCSVGGYASGGLPQLTLRLGVVISGGCEQAQSPYADPPGVPGARRRRDARSIPTGCRLRRHPTPPGPARQTSVWKPGHERGASYSGQPEKGSRRGLRQPLDKDPKPRRPR
jgi:hypothetical protein